MGQFFDITRKKSNSFENTNKNPKKTGNYSVYYFVIIVLAIVLIYSFSSLSSNPENQTKANQSEPNSANLKKDSSNSSMNSSDANLPDPASSSNEKSNANNQNFSSNNTDDLNKTKLTVKVLNGSGKTGAAAETKSILEKEGFVVSEIGNADSTYKKTIIYYSSGNEESANLIKKTLSNYEVSIESNNEITNEFDIVVVIGQK